MKKTKTQKGITLIALIITIVVLLIIAVVTIGAIRDSKIISHAQNASNDYTIAQEKEQIGLALSEWQIQKVLGGKSFEDVVSGALSGKGTVEENSDGTLTVTMETGNQYIVTPEGEIVPGMKTIILSDTTLSILKGKTKTITASLTGGLKPEDITYSSSDESVATVTSSGVITAVSFGDAIITAKCGDCSTTCKVTVREASDLDYYFFGQELAGRNITEIADINTGKFTDDTTTEGNESEIVVVMSMQDDEGISTSYITYQNMMYKIKANMNTYMTDAEYGLIIIEKSEGTRVGKTVKYDNKLWTILYDDDKNGLQMISNEGLDYFRLGSGDSSIKDWSLLDKNTEEFKIADLDENKVLDNEVEKTLYSYNNLVDTLNTACDNIVADSTNIIKVRCVGSNPINKDDENEVRYTSDKLAQWPTSNATYKPGALNGKVKGPDINYLADFERMLILDIYNLGTSYWYASRGFSEDSEDIEFRIRDTDSDGSPSGDYWLEITESRVIGNDLGRKLRPVVSLKTDIQFAGSGTEADPYTF